MVCIHIANIMNMLDTNNCYFGKRKPDNYDFDLEADLDFDPDPDLASLDADRLSFSSLSLLLLEDFLVLFLADFL